MPDDAIYVDNELFLGRVEEQKQFRAALHEILSSPHGETLPYVFLLYGDGGIGKTTLAKRFRDIACNEPGLEGEFQTWAIDWETQRQYASALRGPRDQVSIEAVLDILHRLAVDQGWKAYLRKCEAALIQVNTAQRKAERAIDAVSGRDEWAAVRGASAATLAKFARAAIPQFDATLGPAADSAETLATNLLDAGIRLGADRAGDLVAALTAGLHKDLDADEYSFFIDPQRQLARALAEDLRDLSKRRPLLIFLDTYEIVDHCDPWLRQVMLGAGPRIGWIVGGRNDLMKSRGYGPDHVKGYDEDFPRRLVAYNMRQLAADDVRRYFANCVPERPLSPAELTAIVTATRGIPLAVRQAADIWGNGATLDDIVTGLSATTPAREIVKAMCERYLVHVVAENDRLAIYALALARGNVDVLRAMLAPANGERFNLEDELARLARAYASVHADNARLHDDPAFFLQEYLKADIRRTDEPVQNLNRRAVAVLQARLAHQEAELPLIEECCADDDWIKTVLDLTYHLFWLDETAGWRWLIQRYVEGLAYSAELCRGLMQVLDGWKSYLSAAGRKRLKAFSRAANTRAWIDIETRSAMLEELARAQRLGWLAGPCEDERRAILLWQQAESLKERNRLQDALTHYEQAEQLLPDGGESLQGRLSESYYDISVSLIWSYHRGDPIYSQDAEHLLRKVVAWAPDKAEAWRNLGITLRLGGKPNEALATYQQAIGLSLNTIALYNSLGNVYDDLGRYDEALAAYQQASALDPKFAYPHNGQGNVYRSLGRYDEALAAYQQASALDPKFAYPHNNLAGIYITRRQFDEARRELAERIRLAPENTFGPLVSLGVLQRYQGQPESDTTFRKALEGWQTAWRLRWQTCASMLQDRATALLCLGRQTEAMEAAAEARACWLRGDQLDDDSWELLRTAPVPPSGLQEVLDILTGGGETH
jgi:tetratricopeptide (TPR) repeat protein